ncbi:MAG: ATP phosphoribosyltransferase regulatory subunit, partial [Candidatus Wildermuthbacteria bacterium]|nr:ATP phosphoribosyltransferase regulatory subunit [Candidatus Wildermuthbacteria bacterium]
FLDEADLPYHLDPYLVRGLDYYTKTVFEIVPDRQQTGEAAPIALAGGGRFDTLLKILGNKDVPATGAAAGIERIISLMKEKQLFTPPSPQYRIFLAQLGDAAKKKSIKLLEAMREANIRIAESVGRDSLRAQLAKADKLQVEYTLILGQREVLDNTIVIRKMETGTQETVRIDKALEEIKKRLKR